MSCSTHIFLHENRLCRHPLERSHPHAKRGGWLSPLALLGWICVSSAACGDTEGSSDEGSASDTEASTTFDSLGTGPSDPSTDASTSGSMSMTTGEAGTTGGSDSDPSGSGSEGTGQGSGEFSDEFDDPATLADWTRRHEAEGGPAQYTTLDISETNEGQLTIIPTAGGWFNEFDGPFLYKMVEGDFILETQVVAESRQSPGEPPMNLYNSAGLMVRDPEHGPGSENWVIHNVGRQSLEMGVATEGKTTTNSTSILELVPGTNSGRLRICRIGADVILARMLADENTFTETHRYVRGDMNGELQVGLMVNGWNSNGSMPDTDIEPDVIGRFDYVRLSQPQSEADCFAD